MARLMATRRDKGFILKFVNPEETMLITPAMRALVGQEATFQATEPVDAGKIRRFAKALDLKDSAYYDLVNNQPIAPLIYVFSVNHDSLIGVDESGRPLNRLSLPPPFGPAIRGGNKLQFYRPVRVGDRISIRRQITDLKEKQGRLGLLVFLTYDLQYTNQEDELLGFNTETLIFPVVQERGKNRSEGRKTGDRIAFQVNGAEEIPPLETKVSKVRMMMYAAATWNPYQLHWDSDYSRKNGYADANIAGPMFGAYLVEMLIRWAGSPAKLFRMEYTNRAMAFPEETLICRGKVRQQVKEANQMYWDCQVWVENREGLLLVEGQAAVKVV